MTPPPSQDDPCSGCFLREQTGGVCPMARNAYGWQNPAETQRRANALHAAIARDALTAVSLPELVRREAASGGALAAARRLGLLAAPLADPIPDPQKEVPHAFNANRALR